jgi:hypothetical protein
MAQQQGQQVFDLPVSKLFRSQCIGLRVGIWSQLEPAITIATPHFNVLNGGVARVEGMPFRSCPTTPEGSVAFGPTCCSNPHSA